MRAKIPLAKVKARWEDYQARMLHYALERGVLAGQRDYTKFLILTRSRSGSNFLVDLLNSHSKVLCYSELFSPSGVTHWGVPGYGAKQFKSESVRRLKEEDPVKFMTQYVYKTAPGWISAVGFKLFYNHAKEGKGDNLWKYLEGLEDLRVIHLKRKNTLKTVVSQKIAMASGVWVKRAKHGAAMREAIELSHDECLTQFERTRRWQEEYDEYFAPKEKMDVIFEDLVADTDRVMYGVQSFLGVESQRLTAGTQKQSSKPLVEVVANYKQLRDSFSGTEWEAMFESPEENGSA